MTVYDESYWPFLMRVSVLCLLCQHALCKKGLGCGLNQSDVICSTVGWMNVELSVKQVCLINVQFNKYLISHKQLIERIIPTFEKLHRPGSSFIPHQQLTRPLCICRGRTAAFLHECQTWWKTGYDARWMVYVCGQSKSHPANGFSC